MTTLIFAVEGYSDSLRKFEKDWHGKTYAGGKAKLRVREVKFYTFSVNEAGRDECLADFKALCGSYDKPVGNSMFFKYGFILEAIRFGLRLFGLKKVKDSEIKAPAVNREEAYIADKAVLAHFVFLGEMKDPRLPKDGSWGKKGEEVI